MNVNTASVEFGRWSTISGDDELHRGDYVRAVHYGRRVEFGGPSHRLKESLVWASRGACGALAPKPNKISDETRKKGALFSEGVTNLSTSGTIAVRDVRRSPKSKDIID